MLKLKNVSKEFGKLKAVDNISFEVKKGKIFGLVGRNGAGKSTTFRLILNIIEPSKGSISYDGKKINSDILDRFQKKGV